MSKRYLLKLDTYLFGRNDNDAKVLAAKFIEFLNSNKVDNIEGAQAITLHSASIGSFDIKLIHEGNLRLLDNKLV